MTARPHLLYFLLWTGNKHSITSGLKGRGIDIGCHCCGAARSCPARPQSGKMDVTTTKRSMSLTKDQNKLKLDAEPRQCVFCM